MRSNIKNKFRRTLTALLACQFIFSSAPIDPSVYAEESADDFFVDLTEDSSFIDETTSVDLTEGDDFILEEPADETDLTTEPTVSDSFIDETETGEEVSEAEPEVLTGEGFVSYSESEVETDITQIELEHTYTDVPDDVIALFAREERSEKTETEDIQELSPVFAVTLQGDTAKDFTSARQMLEEETNLQEADVSEVLDSLFDIGEYSYTGKKTFADENDPPRQLDGSNIENISAKWITEDTVDNGDSALLYVKPADDELQTIRLQVNYALSGEHNYEPGDVVITVPTHIIYKRGGQEYGTMIIPFPEDPSMKSDFAWTQIGDNYVLTSTKKMSAATKGYIQFGITDLRPHELVDMQESDPFSAYIEVTTYKGNTIALRSNELTCEFDTEAKITNTSKRRYTSPYRVSASSIPQSQRVANETEYIMVDWYVWGYTVANTEYTMAVEDTIPDEYSGFIIGATSADGRSLSRNIPPKYSDGDDYYYYYKTAYPASQFQPDVEYTFHNTITMTATEVDPAVGNDPQLVTQETASADAVFSYTLPVWKNPTGHFMVCKNGNDDTDKNNRTRHPKYVSNSDYPDEHIWYRRSYIDGWYGIYPSALNEINEGNDIRLSYTIDSVGYIMPWTYDPQPPVNEMSARLISNYFRRAVTITTEDTGISIGRNTPKLQVLRDYEFVSVEILPDMWIYKGKPQNINPDGSWTALTAGDGTFTYERDDDKSKWPDITLQIYRNSAWSDYAVASWKSGSLVVKDMSDNVISNVVDVPADTENFRTVVTLTNAAIDYDIRPVVRLKSTQAMQALTDAAFEVSYTPSMRIYNGVVMTANRADTGEELVRIEKDGYDDIRGYTTDTMVVPEKTGLQTLSDVDNELRLTDIHYTATVSKKSFINDKKTYEQAVKDGRLLVDTEGVWYDLLPKGVVPKTDTIELRDGDSIKSVYTLEDYKGSGRTLLVVKVKLTPEAVQYKEGDLRYYMDQPTIKFDAYYTFEDMIDYGYQLHNVIAFETMQDEFGTIEHYSGEPDDPTVNNNISTVNAFADQEEITAMTDLDANKNTPSFVYAGTTTIIDALSAARTSLSKDVMVNNDGRWSMGVWDETGTDEYNHRVREEEERIVYTGGQYSYRLRMMSDDGTISKDLILYDSLENFYAQNNTSGTNQHAIIDIGAPRWQGTFRGVDTSQLEAQGCGPVVYYSTVTNLQLSDETDPTQGNTVNMNLNNASVWTRADQFTGPLSSVKAIAVDASKMANGVDDFTLDPLESAVVIINMTAPSGTEASGYIAQDAHAYNNTYLLCTSIDSTTGVGDSDNFIRKDYTKVGLEEYKLTINKVWDDDGNRDGIRPNSTTYTLYANDVSTGQTVTITAPAESAEFNNIPYCDPQGNKYIYSIVETDVPGYKAVLKQEGTVYTFTNKHEPELAVLDGTKTWVGDEPEDRPESIKVTLYANGEYVTEKTVRDPWTYSFKNMFKYENGSEIVYTIRETMEGKGLSYVSAVDGMNITNTYHPFGELSVAKTATQTTSVSENTDFTFTFEFTKTEDSTTVPVFDVFNYDVFDASDNLLRSGTVETNGTIVIKKDQRIQIHEIPENTHYKIVETELPGFKIESSENTAGTIEPNKTSSASFVNQYEANGALTITAEKTLNNRELQKYQFRFVVKDTNDEPVRYASNAAPTTVTRRNDDTIQSSEAPVTFGTIRYTQEDAGKTFVYTIEEDNKGKPGYTYDDTVYTATVTVTDNGDGTLSVVPVYTKNSQTVTDLAFENTYSASGSTTLRAWKDLKGRKVQANEFEFVLLDENRAVLDTKRNDAEGAITFADVSFDETDIGKTYYYAIREVAGNDPTVIYDDTIYGYKIMVEDNGDGTLAVSLNFATPVLSHADIARSEDAVKYAVALYGIGETVDENGDTMGLTFGPALGKNYVRSYKSHTPSGTTTEGNSHRCLHNDSWSEIIHWNNEDPYVYEQCIEQGCTHSVLIEVPEALSNPEFSNARETGDGPSALRNEISHRTYGYQNLFYNPLTVGGNGTSGTNLGGWGASRIRAMLNGADELTTTTEAGGGYAAVFDGSNLSKTAPSINVEDYSFEMCLFAGFPVELQNAIGAREVKYDSVASSKTQANLRTSYDKLWLLSTNEITSQGGPGYAKHPLEASAPFSKFTGANAIGSWAVYNSTEENITEKEPTLVPYVVNSITGSNNGSAYTTVLRSINSTYSAVNIRATGNVYSQHATSAYSVAPCFSLKANAPEPVQLPVGWTDEGELPVFKNELKDGSLSITKTTTNAENANPNDQFHFRVTFVGVDDSKTFNYEFEDPRRETITLTYDGNGGYFNHDQNQTENLITYKLQDGDYTLFDGEVLTPEKRGGAFDGWYEDQDFVFPYDTSKTPSADKTVYAKWNITQFTTGSNVASRLNSLVPKATITSVTFSDTQPDAATLANAVDLATNTSAYPIYAWKDGTDIKLWSEADEVYTNPDASNMFSGLTVCTEIDADNFNTSRTTTMSTMFLNCKALTSIDVSGFDTSNVTNMSNMFFGCKALTSLDVSGFDTSKVTSLGAMFAGCNALTNLDVSGFDTSNVTKMSSMFSGCNALTSLDVSGFDTAKVTDMSSMFYGCETLTSLDVSGFDTSNVTNMSQMFTNCNSLTSLDVSGFDTSNVTNMGNIFQDCKALTSLDVSGFDTSKVTTMVYMFQNCKALTNLDVSGFDTSNVKDMRYMFKSCSALTSLDISGFNTSNVTNMAYMFDGCDSITSLNLSGFNTAKVTNMSNMFYSCDALANIDVSSFDTSNVTTMGNMFNGDRLLTPTSIHTADNWPKSDGSGIAKCTNFNNTFLSCQATPNWSAFGSFSGGTFTKN